MAARVLVYEPDLFFSSRIESIGERFGLEVKITTTMKELTSSLNERLPEVLLVNLDALAERHESLAGLLPTGRCRILGYYSHVDAKSAEEALRSGFDLVIPRRSFMVKVSEIFAQVAST